MGIVHSAYDVIVVGGGGAGLRAALELADAGIQVAVVSKVFPTRSHTVSAQGGIAATLGNAEPDDWRWHMFDTIKGSDYLGDQDSIEYMCRVGPEVIYELEHFGMPFSRFDNGRIYQRAFGGQTKNYGGELIHRTCAAADRTGHALLHTLFQQNIRTQTTFFHEWYAIDLVKTTDGTGIAGVLALHIATGEVVCFECKAVILATGGAGQIYASTTNALINTGDGLGMVLRAGYPLQDMEMWQFHPTGIAGAGVLVTEGCRGEGGYLLNKNGERFMERYAPNKKDLASRDVVSRAMSIEIREGRGCGPQGDHVWLKLDHLGESVIQKRLPGIRDLAKTFAHVDPVEQPIPVVPTVHYMMGGIPTTVHGQALHVHADGTATPIPGLYAVGECACVSVHGANRLGSNSLLDLVVFGRAAGLHLKAEVPHLDKPFVTTDQVQQAVARMNRWEQAEQGEPVAVIRRDLQHIMQHYFGVFRTESVMQEGLKKLQAIRERIQHAVLRDKSRTFNTARVEALETDNLVMIAMATALSALYRQESRGAHSREDYPERDDARWLKHTVAYGDDRMGTRPVNMSPVAIEPFAPKERVY